MKRILCIWFPHWSRQREQAARPRPLDGKQRTDHEALAALAQWCRRFSPTVAVEPPPEGECIFLDITGLEHLYSGEQRLAERVLRRLARRGLNPTLAVAETLGAAWAVSHRAASSPLAIVPAGEVLPWLRPLPVSALRLSQETIATLHQLGVERIEQLERLPRAELASRFGDELLRRWDQATGLCVEPLPAQQPPPELTAHEALEHPTASREILESLLAELLARVEKSLAEHGLGALRLECRLDCPPAEPVLLSLGLFRPIASARQLHWLLAMQLDRIRLPASVAAVRVEVSAAAPASGQQQELFPDGSAPRQPRRLADLLDRLSSQLGRGAVLRARLVADAQPERAYRYHPWIPEPGARRDRTQRGRDRDIDLLPPRPLRLLERPIAVDAVSILPEGPPVRFPFQDQSHQVASARGPERIETGWWRGRSVGRDYYRVETAAGRRFWLYRRLSDGRWFLHGLFE